jgi:hypothetical protein
MGIAWESPDSGKYDQALSLPWPKTSRPPNPGGVPRLFVGHFRTLKGLTALPRDFLLVLAVLCFGHKGPAKVAESLTGGSYVVGHRDEILLRC